MSLEMAPPSGDEVLAAGLVRIRSQSGEVVGTGFLIDAEVVCTCAHVVALALGVSESAELAPADPVLVEFPLVRDGNGAVPRCPSTVEVWRPVAAADRDDVALLRLERPVPGTRPVPLVDGSKVWDHPFRVMGFPRGAEDGVWASGSLRSRQGTGWLQMETGVAGQRIARGFSGSPVWDDIRRGVVGMTVAVQRGTDSTTAYLIPSGALLDERLLPPRCPFPGLASFTEAEADLFHGRQEDTERILAAVRRRPLTFLVGASGCGKSSLIRAGLVPRLRTGLAVAVSELRAVPGVRAAAGVAQTLAPLLTADRTAVEQIRAVTDLTDLLSDRLDQPGPGLDELTAELRGQVLEAVGENGLVVFVDQLEEYATADPTAARELMRLLVSLCAPGTNTGWPALRIVATARPESLDLLLDSANADLLSTATQYLAQLSPEQLLEAVTAPVAGIPGLSFEAGLPARIVADAADEPGRMPLVQFALTRLWDLRDGSTLTHAAYYDLGGVAGALVGFAEECMRTRLGEDEEDLARRLFTQLARPNTRGGFTRHPARLAALDPALRDLALRLAPTRLVVPSRTSDGEEVVDLAHEALVTLWPRLEEWLEDSRGFRVWQEELRADLERWENHRREPGQLLRGGALNTAMDQLAGRPKDIAPEEAEFIQLSYHRRRREVRVLRSIIACLASLVLLTGGLAAWARHSSQEAEAQLRTQASRLLATVADQHAADEPAVSLQLALAAWNAGQTPEAYNALLREYTRGQQLSASWPGLWPGRFQKMAVTPDARTAVVFSVEGTDDYRVTVVTGLADGTTRQRPLNDVPADIRDAPDTALSPDGRWFASIDKELRVRLWDLRTTDAPRVFEELPKPDAKFAASAGLSFSSDGRRLLRRYVTFDSTVYTGAPEPLWISVWEAADGRPVPTAPDLLRGRFTALAFAGDADRIVLEGRPFTGEPAIVRDIASGRDVRTFEVSSEGVTSLAANGEWVVVANNGGKEGPAQAFSTRAGEDRVTALPFGLDSRDLTGRFLLLARNNKQGGYREISATEVRTGRVYRGRIPATTDDSFDLRETLAVVPRPDGTVSFLLPTADTLLTAVAVPIDGASRLPRNDTDTRGALAPSGQWLAEAGDTTLTVADTATNSRKSVTYRPENSSERPEPFWSADSRWILLEQPGGTLTAFAADDPAGRRVDLHWEDGDAPARKKGVESVEALQGSEMAVLTTDGRLLLMDAATGRRIAPPIQVERKTTAQAADPFASYGQLRARPKHPDEIAVVTGSARASGTVELWNIRTGSRIRTLAVGELGSVGTPAGTRRHLLFTPDGRELFTSHPDHTTRHWDLDSGTLKERPITSAAADLSVPLAVGPDGRLITYNLNALQFWELPAGVPAATLPLSYQLAVLLAGDRLLVAGDGWFQNLDLRPDEMARSLCATVARDFTPAEHALLPAGTPGEPPCDGITRKADRNAPAS
ncbi:trypsin-like peptidase domain-containing protein [Kitasatospora sp. NPDC050463]|uniref:nSTAND1 domain-containing NTPase n=1 Tax=Kitasatospora sp. NPDC050463 TaxID=3155786 RepID=UPI00340E83C1